MLLTLFQLNLQAAGNSQTIAVTLDGISAAVTQTTNHAQSLAASLDGVSVSVTQAANHAQNVNAVLDSVTVTAAQTATHPQAMAVLLDGVSVSVSQAANHAQSVAVVLDGISAAVSQGRLHSQSVAVTLDGITPQANQSLSYAISAQRAALIHQLALLHGLDVANPLTVSAAQRSAGALVQAVNGVSTVTVTTSAAPVFSGNLDAWIDGLAALHGLTAPLVVTATSRAAGAVTQSIAAVNGLTTVTRQ